MQLPPLAEIPEPIRGRSIVLIDGAVQGDPAVIEPLRALGPEIDTFAMVPAPVARAPAPGPRGADARTSSDTRADARAPGRGDRRAARARRPGLRLAAGDRRAAPGRRRAAPAATPGHGAVAGIDGAVRAVRRSAWRSTPTWARSCSATRAAIKAALAPWLRRGPLPQLRRGARSTVASTYGADTCDAAAGRQGPRRPGQRDPREPRHLDSRRHGPHLRHASTTDRRHGSRASRCSSSARRPSGDDGHINVSPKGPIGSLRVLDEHTVAYLDIVGSGAETIAHLRENGRICVMFCAFEGPPRILRLHGEGEVVLPGRRAVRRAAGAPGFDEPEAPEARRAFIVVHVTRIADSCGYGVPLMSYEGERPHSDLSTAKRLRVEGPDAMRDYEREAQPRVHRRPPGAVMTSPASTRSCSARTPTRVRAFLRDALELRLGRRRRRLADLRAAAGRAGRAPERDRRPPRALPDVRRPRRRRSPSWRPRAWSSPSGQRRGLGPDDLDGGAGRGRAGPLRAHAHPTAIAAP